MTDNSEAAALRRLHVVARVRRSSPTASAGAVRLAADVFLGRVPCPGTDDPVRRGLVARLLYAAGLLPAPDDAT